jgi:hypothetical protein
MLFSRVGWSFTCDREGDAHGGVLIASKSEYGLTQVNVSTEAEMITGSIKLGNKQLMPSSAGKISPFPVSFVNQVSVPMMTSG